MLVFSDDKIIYEHIELVYPVCHVLHFVKKIAIQDNLHYL